MRALPDDFHFALHARSQIRNRAHAAEFSFVDDGDPVAERFGVGKNVSGEEYSFAFVLELLHQVAHFAPSHGIEAGHRFIEEYKLGIVQNGLRDSDALQHAFGKFPQLHALHFRQSNSLQRGLNPPRAFFCRNAGKLRVIVQQLVCSQMIIEIRLLRKESNLRFDFRIGPIAAQKARRS